MSEYKTPTPEPFTAPEDGVPLTHPKEVLNQLAPWVVPGAVEDKRTARLIVLSTLAIGFCVGVVQFAVILSWAVWNTPNTPVRVAQTLFSVYALGHVPLIALHLTLGFRPYNWMKPLLFPMLEDSDE